MVKHMNMISCRNGHAHLLPPTSLELNCSAMKAPVELAADHDGGTVSNGNSRQTKLKPKRSRKNIRRVDDPPRRSSIYRGVTRHRWTGRYEAHLWDKHCWNQDQSKKGRQVYLGAYDEEEAAAHAYDLAALKYWGLDTMLNFTINTYTKEIEEMKSLSKEEYVGSLRRKSSGFSRGVSKYRGVARHHHNGRWEARIGRVFGNKYLYLGTYSTQEEAAAAYDMAAIEYRGLNAVTNFDLSHYIKWLRPGHNGGASSKELDLLPLMTNRNSNHEHASQENNEQTQEQIALEGQVPVQAKNGSTPSALSLLLQSSKFKEMLEKTSITCLDHEMDNSQSNHDQSYFFEDMESFSRGSDYILNQGYEDMHSLLGSSNNMMVNMLQATQNYDHLQHQSSYCNTELMDHDTLLDLLNSSNSNGSMFPFGMNIGTSS